MTGTSEKQKERPLHKSLRGEVVSKSGDKTITVDVMNLVKHPLYKKYIRKRTRLAVHDEHNRAGVGDIVEVVTTRPLSKRKAHRLFKIVRAAASG